MAILSGAQAAALLLLCVGCARSVEPPPYTESTAAVHAVIQAGSPHAEVLLTRFRPGDEEIHGVPDALVVLETGSQSVVLTNRGNPLEGCLRADYSAAYPELVSGCYTAPLPRPASPGEEWRLSVRLPDGTEAEGSTEIPSTPSLESPATRSRVQIRNHGGRQQEPGSLFPVPLGSLPLQWSTPPPAARVEVALRIDSIFRGGLPLADAHCRASYIPPPGSDVGARDTAQLTVFELLCFSGTTQEPIPWDSISARVILTAFDSSYAHYVNAVAGQKAVGRTDAAAGVLGVLGVFGSAARASESLLFVSVDP